MFITGEGRMKLEKARRRDKQKHKALRFKVHGRRIGEVYANAIKKRLGLE